MNSRPSSTRAREHAERALVDAILDGVFPPGSVLPGERSLAVQLGVTRPTLREAIQRLVSDGWLTVAHGKPTAVNNYWQAGGLNVLGRLIEHQSHLSPKFISQLLEVRLQLAPAYTRSAVANAASEIAQFLASAEALGDVPADFARFDWRLHHRLTVCSGNPIYTLILNGFEGIYEPMARLYFSSPDARSMSAGFYRQLRDRALAADPDAAEVLSRRVMEASISFWEERGLTDLV